MELVFFGFTFFQIVDFIFNMKDYVIFSNHFIIFLYILLENGSLWLSLATIFFSIMLLFVPTPVYSPYSSKACPPTYQLSQIIIFKKKKDLQLWYDHGICSQMTTLLQLQSHNFVPNVSRLLKCMLLTISLKLSNLF